MITVKVVVYAENNNDDGKQTPLQPPKASYWWAEYYASIGINVALCFVSLFCALAFGMIAKQMGKETHQKISLIQQGISNPAVYDSIIKGSTKLSPNNTSFENLNLPSSGNPNLVTSPLLEREDLMQEVLQKTKTVF